MKFAFVLATILFPAISLAMPSGKLTCETRDAAKSVLLSGQVSLYSGDLYPDSLVFSEAKNGHIPQADVAQFKNDKGELFMKLYVSRGESDDEISGFIFQAKQKGSGKFYGKLTRFVNPDGTHETYEKARTLECAIEP